MWLNLNEKFNEQKYEQFFIQKCFPNTHQKQKHTEI